jgi:DNA helicase IV
MDQAVLVLGEAGHGKTTVALRRLEFVWSALKKRPGRPPRAAVVVPTEGLSRLLQPLLRRLGIDVEARTYDAWARRQARRAFSELPRRETELTPPAVQRVKRSPALRSAIALLAARAPGRIDDDADACVSPSTGLISRGDLQHLFGDRRLLEMVAGESQDIRSIDVEEVLEHNRVTFELSAEDEYSHVLDRRRLRAVDGRPLDEGTSHAHAGCIDIEDYAILFELDRLRAARLGRPATEPRKYDVLLLDEAQEFAPIELALLGRSLAPGGTLIVAGDADQHMDPLTTFPGWNAAMSELGCAKHSAVVLDVGYRCPPPVRALARAVLDGKGTVSAPAVPSRGHASVVGFENDADLNERIGIELCELRRKDPRASVGVLCNSPRVAGRVAQSLKSHVPARLVYDGSFRTHHSIEVTLVAEVKGLEFDYVVIPDASDVAYPDSPAARRAMYVAVTRARFQVLIAHSGKRSPIVPMLR